MKLTKEMDGIERLPAVKWKINNLEGQPEKEREADIRPLERVLESARVTPSVF